VNVSDGVDGGLEGEGHGYEVRGGHGWLPCRWPSFANKLGVFDANLYLAVALLGIDGSRVADLQPAGAHYFALEKELLDEGYARGG
jgi:hypothetical protein